METTAGPPLAHVLLTNTCTSCKSANQAVSPEDPKTQKLEGFPPTAPRAQLASWKKDRWSWLQRDPLRPHWWACGIRESRSRGSLKNLQVYVQNTLPACTGRGTLPDPSHSPQDPFPPPSAAMAKSRDSAGQAAQTASTKSPQGPPRLLPVLGSRRQHGETEEPFRHKSRT